jgi:hypothetical protein
MKHILVLLALFSPLAMADCSTNWMECTTDSQLQISSFVMRATEVIGAITASRNAATQGLDRHEITVADAKVVLSKTDQGRALWQQALAVCHADVAGNCRTHADSAKAFSLLAKAQKAVQ